MEHREARAVTLGRISAGRLLRVGVLAAGFSAIANALVLALASSLFGPVVIPPNGVVTPGRVMAASVAGAFGAAIIFAIIGLFTRRPVRAFRVIAAVGLLLSFVPIALAGVTGSSAGALALMHVVAAVTNVGLLTTLGRKARGATGRPWVWRGGW